MIQSPSDGGWAWSFRFLAVNESIRPVIARLAAPGIGTCGTTTPWPRPRHGPARSVARGRTVARRVGSGRELRFRVRSEKRLVKHIRTTEAPRPGPVWCLQQNTLLHSHPHNTSFTHKGTSLTSHTNTNKQHWLQTLSHSSQQRGLHPGLYYYFFFTLCYYTCADYDYLVGYSHNFHILLCFW